MWIVNHKTLLPAEVPIFRDLGYEVFIPKIIPRDPSYRSGVVTFAYDESLTISRSALSVLNEHEFYGELRLYRSWSPTLREIINDNFDVVISSFSAFISPLREAVRHFDGVVMARTFGLTEENRYIDLLNWLNMPDLLDEIERRRSKYIFVQGYFNLAEIEPPMLGLNAHTVTVPLPEKSFESEGTWLGGDDRAILVCPGIQKSGYYRNLYERIKCDFNDIPHRIFGRQYETIEDDTILPFLSDEGLIDLYRRAPVFIYPSVEARHVHYSPIEAMIVGTPVLYRRGSLIDLLMSGADLAGACADTDEIRDKAHRLLRGDVDLARTIQSEQCGVVGHFRVELARRQWSEILETPNAIWPGSRT